MKTKEDISLELKNKKKELRDIHLRFEKYDNHEDLEEISILDAEIKVLMWVLEKS